MGKRRKHEKVVVTQSLDCALEILYRIKRGDNLPTPANWEQYELVKFYQVILGEIRDDVADCCEAGVPFSEREIEFQQWNETFLRISMTESNMHWIASRVYYRPIVLVEDKRRLRRSKWYARVMVKTSEKFPDGYAYFQLGDFVQLDLQEAVA